MVSVHEHTKEIQRYTFGFFYHLVILFACTNAHEIYIKNSNARGACMSHGHGNGPCLGFVPFELSVLYIYTPHDIPVLSLPVSPPRPDSPRLMLTLCAVSLSLSFSEDPNLPASDGWIDARPMLLRSHLRRPNGRMPKWTRAPEQLPTALRMTPPPFWKSPRMTPPPSSHPAPPSTSRQCCMPNWFRR